MTFREFLEARQMMLFSTAPRELYHGTVTGRNDANLKSFRSRGAVGMSKGYGQSGGFFVYSSKESARRHAVGIATEKASYRYHLDNSGRPMVVTVEAVLDPDDWDIDYELNFKEVMEYLLKNFDAVKEKLQSDDISVEKTTKGLMPWEKPEYYMPKKEDPHPLSVGASDDHDLTLEPLGPMESWLPREIEAGLKDRPLGFRVRAKGTSPLPGTNSRSRDVWHYGRRQERGGLTSDGQSVEVIMNLLRRNDPRVMRSFEELFFANMGPGIAIKHVGPTPLKVKNIEIAPGDGNLAMNQAADDHYWETV